MPSSISKVRTDPLLATARVLLYIFIALFIFGMAMVLIGIGGILTAGRAEVLAAIAEAGAPQSAFWALIAVLLLTEALLFMLLRFCLELRRIVDSVNGGDPFHPDNAGRLSRMGWLSLGAWAVTVPLAALATWLAAYADDMEGVEADVSLDFSTNGLILALVLFILARVFRHGAAMREELEGTV